MTPARIFFSLLLLAFCTFASGQDRLESSLDSFSGKFITAIRKQENERAYLATNKSVFIAGESIWFSAFLVKAVSQKMNTGSRFLFVDLVNEKDSIIKIVILDAVNRQLNSRIILPDFLTTGNYWLRAYTRQMAVHDINNIGVKSIYVIGRTNNNTAATAGKYNGNSNNIPVITFYPEGGSIITGTNSTVALQVNHKNGTPVNIAGYVKDSRDTVVAHFITNRNGLAKFDFEPSGRRRYTAVINWEGKQTEYPLPAFNFFSGQLSVTKEPAGYKLRILLGDSIYREDVVTYLLGVSKDSLIFASIGKGQYEVPVAMQNLPEGVTTFYLLDKGFNLLSERSVYTHENSVHINVTTDKGIYARRDKVTLAVSIMDGEQHPISSVIAVSVTDTLFAGLPGQCDSPATAPAIDNVFLARHECLCEDDIDLLMLVKNNTNPMPDKTSYPPVTGVKDSLLYIKGRILNEKDEPSANKILTLISRSGNLILRMDTTDNIGRFRFPFENYADSTEFVMEIKNANGRTNTNTIVLNPLTYPKLRTPVSFKQSVIAGINPVKKMLAAYFDTAFVDWDKEYLPRVTVRDGKKPANYDESKRITATSTIITSDELGEKNSVGNTIQNVGGLHLLAGYLVMGGPTTMSGPDATSEPILLVDGVQVLLSADMETSPLLAYLNSLNPKDIDFIEVLKGSDGANYGMQGGHGVILVNRKNTRKDPNRDGSNLKVFYAKGVSAPAPFPGTDYQRKDAKTAAVADKRSTLYWNGSLLSDETHPATLTFYTSDIPSTYRVTITGVTIHGDILYKTITFQSK
jgi:TonB-dependent Receptor Plug Domain